MVRRIIKVNLKDMPCGTTSAVQTFSLPEGAQVLGVFSGTADYMRVLVDDNAQYRPTSFVVVGGMRDELRVPDNAGKHVGSAGHVHVFEMVEVVNG